MKEAEKLAARPYIDQVIKDETTSGKPIFVALSPELEGCIAQGVTLEEAIQNLKEARIDYIYSLLEDGLPVPKPQVQSTTTTSGSTVNLAYVFIPDTSTNKWITLKVLPDTYQEVRLASASLPA